TRYEVFGDPDGLVRTVEDDPGEGYTGGAGATVFTCDHAWSTCCTDGVVLTGLDGIWSLIMEFTSITGMNSWVVYSGDSSTIALALQQNRRIRIELVFEPSPADCNANGIPDACDLAAGTSPDCNGNSLPDECEVPPMGTGPDCNVDGVPDECQLADNDCNSNSIPDDCELEGNDCNGNGVPDECEPDCNSNGVADECDITGDTSTDCNENDIPDDCDITAGTSADCNNNNMPDECELATNDCNNNGFPDDCDVAAGTSPDCNSSGVPDECELADNDCNENGIPDECDIAAGTSEDCQPNGIPDECDLVTGKVWDRSEDWVPGTTHGSTAGNPANDSYGNPVWSYEWAQGGALGSGTPWYAQPPTLLVWDDDWFEHGVGCWARADNACPPISGGLTQCLSSSAWNYVPLVRWANPMGDGFQLDIEGVLTVMWSGQNGVGSPCDVDVVIAHADVSAGTTIPLYAVTASKPTPGDSVGDTVDLPVQLDDVVVDAGDSIVFTFRTRVSIQNRWNYLDDNVILRERGGAGDCNENGIPDDCDVAAGTSPDCNGSGVPDECELEGNDCNSSGVPDECELEGNDCNENGIPDECDVAVLDCNGNSIPDDCELEGNDCNENGIPDDCDVAVLDCNNSGIPDDCELEGNDCNGNGIPDECDPDCNSNGFPDDCDLTAGTSPDCNGNNVPDECDIAGGTSLDRNGNGIPDECEADCNNNGVPDDWDIAAGTSEDCNSSGIPDECELAGNDCNDNGVPDECDLAGGTSSDCNSNSIPDECDIAGDTAPDCNGNAVPDECDVAAGTSADCQPDGVPDECQLGGVVHFTDFESGAGGEWSSSATDNSVPNPFTRFSGRFDNSTQTLTLDVVAGLTYELTFDLMIIDSWDGNGPGGGNADWFNVHIDGVRVFHETFSNFDFGNQTYPHAPDVGPAGYGWGGGWPESIYRGVTLSFVPGGSTVQISFSGQDLQEISDESWGIDNVRVASGFGGDCNGNGIPDECDVAAGTSPDCNSTGIPDECELEGNDCNSSGVPDECELEGNDCNNNGIPDECDVAQQDCNNSGVPDDCELEGNDCNANGIPDECDVAQQDCNNSGVPDDCELEGNDCNNNGIPDECDISGETSKDCNENSVPDECDIAAGTAEDCNNNGTPDNCDISAGSSADCNSNGVPDECDMVWSTPLGEGLVLWLSADAVSGVGEGQPVSIWSDQSESSLDVAQSTPSAQPVYTGNVLNGLPALRFDGNDSFTRGSVLGSALTGTDQATIFLVEKQDGSDPHNSTLGWGTSTNRLLLHTTWEDRLHFQHGNANPGGNGSYSVPQPAGWDDAFHVVEFFRNATLAEILVDGNLLGAGTITDTPEINEQHPLYIGTDFFGNTFTGDICEILIYNRALSGLDRLKVSNYLNYKYGIFESGGGPTGDCNLNGVLDECDIAAGTSADCNSNGIPDECETDCNTNGIPDDCDIAAGTSPDCNTSGVP
ncbi:MAG: hypothetical protein KAV82_06395, partial [Phycisphaerae bacterium]|nr:hypothetical protein [Phycisphaerae bacterium]